MVHHDHLHLAHHFRIVYQRIEHRIHERQEAEERQRLSALKKPLEKRIAWLESEIAKLNEQKAVIDNRLADTGLYEPAQRDTLKKTLADQAACTKQLSVLEEEWLEKQDELEKVLSS